MNNGITARGTIRELADGDRSLGSSSREDQILGVWPLLSFEFTYCKTLNVSILRKRQKRKVSTND